VVGFVVHQRSSAHPLMRLDLFEHRAFAMGGCVAFIYGMALFGSTYLVPVFMQIALHLPPSQAGAVLLPAGLCSPDDPARRPAGRPLAGQSRRRDRAGAARAVVRRDGHGRRLDALWLIALWAAIGRVGLGFVLPSLNLGSMRGLPNQAISHGSSTINFLRQLGGAAGISLVGSMLEWRLQAEQADPLRAFHETFVLIGLITAVCRDRGLAHGHAGARRRVAAMTDRAFTDDKRIPAAPPMNLGLSALPERCDVLVVGAGPAGSACAATLARAGFDVVLVDAQAFPRDKVCGDGLIPDAHHAMRRLGVLDEVMALAQQAGHVACIGPRGGRVDVPGTLAVLQRRQLDDVLCRSAAAAGARMHAPARFMAPLEEVRDGVPHVVGARLQAERDARDPRRLGRAWRPARCRRR
jgi:hypothetical protein